MDKDSVIHFLSGGLGGACGAAVINPLEVLKTRLQSSGGHPPPPPVVVLDSSGSSAAAVSCPSAPKVANGSTTAATADAHKRVNTIKASGRFEFWRQPLVALSADGSLRGGGGSSGASGIAKGRGPASSSRSVQTQASSYVQERPTLRGLLRHIVRTEGVLALWKGFGTTLFGVFPSRAIYFYAYSNAKTNFNVVFPAESSAVHMSSAAFAGFCCTTLTNPLWMIRTRLQLDRRATGSKLSVSGCISKVYNEFGLKGFYRGVTASYLGIVETALHFTIYERLKRSSFLSTKSKSKNGDEAAVEEDSAYSIPLVGPSDYFRFMICASISRMIAATIGYPHEVLRTRLREENSKYNGLWRTAKQITREESWRALYGGLSVHLLRTVPNTAITMATYEMLVVLFTNMFA